MATQEIIVSKTMEVTMEIWEIPKTWINLKILWITNKIPSNKIIKETTQITITTISKTIATTLIPKITNSWIKDNRITIITEIWDINKINNTNKTISKIIIPNTTITTITEWIILRIIIMEEIWTKICNINNNSSIITKIINNNIKTNIINNKDSKITTKANNKIRTIKIVSKETIKNNATTRTKGHLILLHLIEN